MTTESAKVPVATVEKRAAPAKKKSTNTFDAGSRSDGSLTIEAPDLALLSKDQNTTMYWCGATMDSLIQTIDVKGVSFPRYTNIPEVKDKLGADGQPQFVGSRKPDLGKMVALTDAQVAAFIQAVKRKILRRIDKRRGQIMELDRENYRADLKRDRPLGEVIYMVRADDMTGTSRRRCPKPLISKE